MLHEPRIVVTNLLNEDSDKEIRRLAESMGSLRLSIDDMLQRRDAIAIRLFVGLFKC